MFDDRTPIYRQIADQIREDVVSGALVDEEQVMSTNQYAAFHRINPATAAKAFQTLVDEGVLYKRRGVGMFVAPGATERLRGERRADYVERAVVPLVREATRLDLSLDDVLDAVRTQYTRAAASAAGDHPRTLRSR